jgi:hypothetical protein
MLQRDEGELAFRLLTLAPYGFHQPDADRAARVLHALLR